MRDSIYDPACLALDVTGLDGAAYRDFIDTLPLVNRLLAPLMVRERVALGGGSELDLLRYPGALFPDPAAVSAPPRATGWIVRLPRVVSRDAEGAESIEWVDVVEEVGAGSFSLSAGGPDRGLVALRLHYPFQAATLAASTPGGTGLGDALVADDSAVTVVGGGAAPIDVGGATSGPHAGRYGLGALQALGGQSIRPFRRFLSAQSVFRREVFL